MNTSNKAVLYFSADYNVKIRTIQSNIRAVYSCNIEPWYLPPTWVLVPALHYQYHHVLAGEGIYYLVRY